jgi:transposase InsO family protein
MHFDQGGEFIGQPFVDTLLRHHIHPSMTTVKNPQANAICERLHQTVSNALRPVLHAHQPNNEDEAALIMGTDLQTSAYSARAAIHGSLKITPGALVFHRDMILNIPIIADLELLRQRRQALIDEEQLIRANRRRISHDYQPNDEVQMLAYKPGKLDPRASAPFRNVRIRMNGTVTIQRRKMI